MMFGGDVDLSTSVDDIQAAMRPLAQYDDVKLQEILDNDVKTEEYISSINMATRNLLTSKKEMTMAENKSIAEYNLSLQPQLENGKSNLKELMKQIEQVRSSILQKQAQLKTSMNAETALALLQTSAAESEEKSEELANSFYQKDVDVDEFLDKFQGSRKTMHLRRVKAEKMTELLSQKNTRPPTAVPRRSAPLPPYPVGPPYFNNFS